MFVFGTLPQQLKHLVQPAQRPSGGYWQIITLLCSWLCRKEKKQVSAVVGFQISVRCFETEITHDHCSHSPFFPQGSFFNGLFHGRGMLENKARNHLYFGEFENGERSGEGDEMFSDGSRYEGAYKGGQRCGAGTLFNPDGIELYCGVWREDMRHGKGRQLRHRREGSSWEGCYEGDFFQDKFTGTGKYTYTDGTSIEGQWLDDVPRDGDW